MSFGYSVSDVFLLGQLAWNTIQNARKACGEHDGLTREVSVLHVVLRRLEQELKKPESPLNTSAPGDTCREEFQTIMEDCGRVLRVLDKILGKYNALSEKEQSGRKLWQRIKFGNGEMADLGDLRSKIILYTSSITFYLNMLSMGTVGRIEQKMNKSGGILREIQLAINGITTQFISRNNYEGSVFTNYADDDKSVWREFRRELRQEGFSSSVIHKHKHLILDYIKELGSRGLLDDQDPHGIDDEWPDLETGSLTDIDTGSSDAFTSKPPHTEVSTSPLQSTGADLLHAELKADMETGTHPSLKDLSVDSEPNTSQPSITKDGELKRAKEPLAETIKNSYTPSSVSVRAAKEDEQDERKGESKPNSETEKQEDDAQKQEVVARKSSGEAVHSRNPPSLADDTNVITTSADAISRTGFISYSNLKPSEAEFIVDREGRIYPMNNPMRNEGADWYRKIIELDEAFDRDQQVKQRDKDKRSDTETKASTGSLTQSINQIQNEDDYQRHRKMEPKAFARDEQIMQRDEARRKETETKSKSKSYPYVTDNSDIESRERQESTSRDRQPYRQPPGVRRSGPRPVNHQASNFPFPMAATNLKSSNSSSPKKPTMGPYSKAHTGLADSSDSNPEVDKDRFMSAQPSSSSKPNKKLSSGMGEINRSQPDHTKALKSTETSRPGNGEPTRDKAKSSRSNVEKAQNRYNSEKDFYRRLVLGIIG